MYHLIIEVTTTSPWQADSVRRDESKGFGELAVVSAHSGELITRPTSTEFLQRFSYKTRPCAVLHIRNEY